MSDQAYKTLLVDVQAGVCTVMLNRPEVRNAMSLAMVHELLQALDAAERDAQVRVLVLSGAGGHFCAGGDIGDMAQARMRIGQAEGDPIAEVNAAFGRLCVAYANTGLPVVTVLEGTVMGGGFGLACVSDVCLALDNAVFRLPETSLGIIPAQIAPFLVERLGYAEAKRLAVTGARVTAAEALVIRLVHEVAQDAAGLQEALARQVKHIMACAPGAVATTKRLLARARREPAADLIGEAAALFSRAVLSDEGQEGTSAFMQKRQPHWVR